MRMHYSGNRNSTTFRFNSTTFASLLGWKWSALTYSFRETVWSKVICCLLKTDGWWFDVNALTCCTISLRIYNLKGRIIFLARSRQSHQQLFVNLDLITINLRLRNSSSISHCPILPSFSTQSNWKKIIYCQGSIERWFELLFWYALDYCPMFRPIEKHYFNLEILLWW